MRVGKVSPGPGNYGIATVIRVEFNRAVPVAARATVLSKISVTASRKTSPTGWAWYGNQTAIFRPKKFWPARTSVMISATPDGTALPGGNLIWAGSVKRGFTIGRSQVIRVSATSHRAVVIRDGKTIRTMGVSLGMPGWVTRSGIKALADGYRVRTMTGESIGAGDYTLQVPYAIRITDSGEFIHGAPWAAARIGRSNGSHGCTNLNLADARWVFGHYLIGDPVITTGTGRRMEPWNGSGGPWNLSWQNWSVVKSGGGPRVTPTPSATPAPSPTATPSSSTSPSPSPTSGSASLSPSASPSPSATTSPAAIPTLSTTPIATMKPAPATSPVATAQASKARL